VYAFTLAPLFLLYLDTACFFVSFFVARPTTAAARIGSSGIGISTTPFRADHIILYPPSISRGITTCELINPLYTRNFVRQ